MRLEFTLSPSHQFANAKNEKQKNKNTPGEESLIELAASVGRGKEDENTALKIERFLKKLRQDKPRANFRQTAFDKRQTDRGSFI